MGIDDRDARRRAGRPALDAEGRGLGALAADGGARVALQDAPGPARAEPAPPAARAAGIGQEFIGLDPHREAHLDDLHGRVHGVGDAARDRADAVPVRPRAEAALDRLVADIVLVGAVVGAAERQHGRGALGAGHHPVRDDRRERAEHHVADAVRHLVIGIDHRGRILRVHHRALGREHLYGAPGAGIGRHDAGRIHRHLEAGEHARGGDRERRVHRAGHLRIGALEIHCHAVAFLDDAQPDVEGLVAVRAGRHDAVPVAEILERALPVRNLAEQRAHHRLGIVHHLLHDALEGLGPVFAGERGQPLAGPPVGRDLGAQVAAALGRGSDIGEDHVLHIAVDRPAPVDAHRRQAQPLAIDVRHRAVASRRGAADIRPVGAHAAEAEQRAVHKGGRDDVHVRQVRAAEIGVVVDEHVAGFDILPGPHHRAHRIGHRTQVDRQVRALGHHIAPVVEDAAGIVPRHLEDRRIGGLGEHHLHLLGDRIEAVLDDLEGGGVGLHDGRMGGHVTHSSSSG